MKRSHPSSRGLILAASLVVVSVVSIVVLPIVVRTEIGRVRARTEMYLVPARENLARIGSSFSQQIALIGREAYSDGARVRTDYGDTVAAQQAALRSLGEHARALGPAPAQRFLELDREARRWHAELERYGREADGQGRTALELLRDAHIRDMMEAVSRLEGALDAVAAEERAEVARIARRQAYVTSALALLGVVAAALVIWLSVWLRRVLAQLEAALRARDEILGIVSHDLRSPLTTIALTSQLMPGSPPAEQAEHADTMRTTVRRMQRLIDDLLDVTKIEQSEMSVRNEQIDPAALAREVVTAHQPIAAEKNLALQSEISDDMPPVLGDHDRLVQALSNLLGNALKFTPAGGTVRFTAAVREGKVRFNVTDSGPGIAATDLPHIFEPFWQGKKTAHLGAGLGLKITRAIAAAHGGSIHVENAPDGGASFTIQLPAATSTASHA